MRTTLRATTLLAIVALLTRLIAPIIIAIIGTRTIRTLRCLTLQACTKALGAESALIILRMLVVTRALICVYRTLSGVNTWTGRTSYWTEFFLITLAASTAVHLLFFLFLFVFEIHNLFSFN
jgi:hypothetical protein